MAYVILVLLSVFAVWLGFKLRDLILVADAPFIPLDNATITALIEYLNKSPFNTFYDLGCGDGRTLFALYGQFPGVQYVGIKRG